MKQEGNPALITGKTLRRNSNQQKALNFNRYMQMHMQILVHILRKLLLHVDILFQSLITRIKKKKWNQDMRIFI